MESIVKELNRPEMEKVVGGDVIDQFKCLISGHDNVFIAEKDNPILAKAIWKFRCRCCGLITYKYVDRRGNTSPAYAEWWDEYPMSY